MKTRSLVALLASVATSILLTVGAACRRTHVGSHQALLDKYVDYWNTGHTDGIEAVLHPDYELRYAPDFASSVKGIAAFRQEMTRMRTLAFAVTMDEAVYGPNTITLRWTCRATFPGAAGGAPRTAQAHGLSLIHLKDGRIADEWIAYDRKQWMEQLGFEMKPK